MTQYILVSLFFLSVGLDVVNNHLIFSYGTNFGIIKFGKTFILLALLFFVKRKESLIFLSALIILYFARIMSIQIQQEDIFLFEDFIVFSRFLLFFAFLIVFTENINKFNLFHKLEKFYIFFIYINTVAIIIGFLFDIAYFRAYEYRGGYKGFFLGPNEMAVFLSFSYFYALVLFRQQKNIIFLSVIFLALAVLAIGSKTAIVATLLVPFIYFLFILLQKKRYIVLFSIFFVSSILVYVAIDLLQNHLDLLAEMFPNSFFNVMLYLKNHYDMNLFSTIMTFRDVNIGILINSIDNVMDFLIGSNIDAELILQHRERNITVIESDPFDYLWRFGFIGFLMVYSFLFFSIRKNNNRVLLAEANTLFVLIFLIGLGVGHTLLSSMNAPWIALLIALLARLEILVLVKKNNAIINR